MPGEALKGFVVVKKNRRKPARPAASAQAATVVKAFPIVGIGASAGGLDAFLHLLKHLPVDTGMGFVLVQHLDPQHESALAQLLGRATEMPVHEVTDRLRVEPNHIYVIPPGKQMVVIQGVLRLQPRVRSQGTALRAIDHFLESLAHDLRERAIGVILSGTATDGTLGLEAIKGEGGITFAQDNSAKYNSMPRSAVAAGCVDFELSPLAIARELARVARHPHVAGRAAPPGQGEIDRANATLHEHDGTPLPSGGRKARNGARQARQEASQADGALLPEPGFKKILLLIRDHAGVDFSLYRSGTIQRRITRRMLLGRLETIGAYALFLAGNAAELDALYSDMLISVTSFFRNADAFDVLQRKVFPKLLAQAGGGPVRIWVLGCSTGQEAYSLAMAFTEIASRHANARRLQIFATDLNEALLNKARAGLYAKSLAQDLSPERLARFFVEEEGGYRANKQLRETVVFARQNMLSDPPFSRMDLVSCRNLLIYIEPALQKRILPMFHYALNPGGTLFLGASESVAGFTDLFEPLDRKQKIFARKAAPAPARQAPAVRALHPADRRAPIGRPVGLPPAPDEFGAQREADRLMVGRFAPPAVLINATFQISQFRGATSTYLEPPVGRASFDLLKMAREGLRLPLRTAISRAKKDGKPVRKDRIRFRHHGVTQLVAIEVIPLKNIKDPSFLVLFVEGAAATGETGPAAAPPPLPARPGRGDARRSHALEGELSDAREYLQSIQEQHENEHEELQASNEEVTSANEELQSLNEELETSKEELESTNEELLTVNEEMGHRNLELNRLVADLNNLHLSINTAILVLNRDLTVRQFTPRAEKTFNLLPTDVNRPLASVRHNLELLPLPGSGSRPAHGKPPAPTLEALVLDVINTVSVRESEVRDRDGHWYALRVRPYLTLDNKIDGAVLVLLDIDALKRGEADTRRSRDYAEAILRTTRTPLLVLRPDLHVNTANAAFYHTFMTTPPETEGRPLAALGNGQWQLPALRQWLDDVVPRNTLFKDFELTHDFPLIGVRTMLLNARRLDAAAGEPAMILLAIEDVTHQRQLNDAAHRSEARFRALVAASSQIVWLANARGEMIDTDSSSWEDFTGQTLAQRQGAGAFEAVHLADREMAAGRWRESLATGNTFEAEYRLRRADGAYRWMAVEAVPVRNTDGSIREWVGMNTDITARKTVTRRLQSSLLRYRSLFEASQDGVLIIDFITRKITEANPFIARLLGYDRGELVGRELGEIGMLRDNGAADTVFQELARTGYVRYENLPLETKTGVRREVEVVATRYEEGPHQVIQCNVRDITDRKHAEEALRASEERYRALFELGPVGVYSCTTSGRLEQFNQRAVELWGREPNRENPDDRFCGSFRLYRPDGSHVPHAECPMAEVATGRVPEVNDTEVVLERPDGTRVTVVVNIRGLRNKRGELVGAINCFYDITERKRAHLALRESEARYRQLFNSIDEGFCVLDLIFDADGHATDYRFVEVNPSFEKQSGLHNATGRSMRELAPDHEPHWYAIYGHVARSGEPNRFVNEARALGRWFDVYAFKLPHASNSRVAVLFQDITAQRANSQELSRVRDEAVAASRAKDQFLAALSHELRTPLNPVLLLASTNALNESLAKDIRTDFETITNNINLEARLIDDLLDLTRISSGKLRMESVACDVHAVFRDALAIVHADLVEKKIRLTLDMPAAPVRLRGDPTRLQQVFWNILRNAIHFTPEGGTIHVAARRLAGPDRVAVTITDNGPGIPAADLERIFDAFAQAEPLPGATRRAGGLGLGLAISRKMVELHAGSIRATSPGPGKGASFVVELPLPPVDQRDEAPPATPAKTRPAPPPARHASRILMVDDHVPTLRTLRMVLERQGYKVYTARSVAEALMVARTHPVDILISDLGLPDGEGHDLLKQLQALHPALRSIAVSGYGSAEDIAKSREAGFSAHLVKPIDITVLNRALASFVPEAPGPDA